MIDLFAMFVGGLALGVIIMALICGKRLRREKALVKPTEEALSHLMETNIGLRAQIEGLHAKLKEIREAVE
jgi:hypothetical protein